MHVSVGKKSWKEILDNSSKPALLWLEGSQNPAHFVKSSLIVGVFGSWLIIS